MYICSKVSVFLYVVVSNAIVIMRTKVKIKINLSQRKNNKIKRMQLTR